MYDLNDTIVAVSSPTPEKHVILRITGPDTITVLNQIFTPAVCCDKQTILPGRVAVDLELEIEARVYLFIAPHSYTGETLAEIHTYTNASVTESLIKNLLGKGLRMAGAGEFTARSFLNGKIDLSQAEAVNEIIVSSNKFQLSAAEKLLAGRLVRTTEKIAGQLMECLGLIEAGLDFSEEDVEFITTEQAVEKLTGIKNELQKLLDGSISHESVIDLPSVGIAGAPGAGKSNLLNKLAGKERSIVSANYKTTRDVLTAIITLPHYKIVLFDCAGLMNEPENILDELAQKRAIESLNHANLIIFCVDVAKPDWTEDLSIRRLIEPKAIIPAATKTDLLTNKVLAEHLNNLNRLFNYDFFAISSKTGTGIEQLRETVDKKLIAPVCGGQTQFPENLTATTAGLTARHKNAVTETSENITQAITEIKSRNNEVAAMLLRNAYQAISTVAHQNIDEKILENIFSRFCIGK